MSEVFYCPITNELWILEKIPGKNYFYGITWNDICFLDQTDIEKSFVYIGEL